MKTLFAFSFFVSCFSVYSQQRRDPFDALNSNAIVRYDSAKTQQGLTLVNMGMSSTFLNMKGIVATEGSLRHICLHHVNNLPDGNFIGNTDSLLIKFDNDMNIIWAVPSYLVHHEITSDDEGNIYLLSSDFHEFMGATVRFDVLKMYNSEGHLIYKWSTYDHLEELMAVLSKSAWFKGLAIPFSQCKNATEYILQYPAWFLFPLYPFQYYDLHSFCLLEFSHFNSIQALPQNEVSKKIPAFKKGNLLLSFNPYSCYGILNPASGKIEWAGYLPETTTLHTPLLTPTGTILVFQNSTDNEWGCPDTSGCTCLPGSLPPQTAPQHPAHESVPWSLAEYDPVTDSKIWEYKSAVADAMAVKVMGSAQRLPNGNTLISTTIEGRGGRIFEVTPGKEIVWDFAPSVPGFSVYRAKRLNLENIKTH